MSDAKQDFIDDVMHLARTWAVEAMRDVTSPDRYLRDIPEDALRAFLQERIGEPVEWKSTCGSENVTNNEKNSLLKRCPPIAATYTIPLYRLDGGHKDV